MNGFLRLLGLVLVVIVGAVSGGAFAAIKITVSDGVTTHPRVTTDPTTRDVPGLAISMTSGAGSTTAMPLFILNSPGTPSPCIAHPCMVYFPSGTDATPPKQPAPGDTFMFRDNCGPLPLTACETTPAPVARVVKTDSDTDRLELKGLQITALPGVVNMRVTITFETEQGDLTPVLNSPTGSTSYPWSVALIGRFGRHPPQTTGGDGGLTTACPALPGPNDYMNPCAQLTLQISGAASPPPPPLVTANDVGPFAIATASLPCKAGSINPCARIGGSYGLTSAFNAFEGGNITFAVPFYPVQKAALTRVFFTNTDQTHSLANSVVTAMSGHSDVDFGVEALFYSLADELGGDRWVDFIAADETYSAVPLISPVQKTSDGPAKIAFTLEDAERIPASDGVTLTSIVTDETLTASERARNTRSYASYIATPEKLRWRDVNMLGLTYDVNLGTFDSGDTRLGKLSFSDCASGSFRLRVALVTGDGLPAGNLAVYLGTKEQFSSGCQEAVAKLSKKNLVQNDEKRVDPSFLLGKFNAPCCTTIKKSQTDYGNLFVRSISVVVDQGWSKPVANYQVRLFDAIVNGEKATKHLHMRGTYAPAFDLPIDGRSIVITKLTGTKIAPVVVGNAAIDNITAVVNGKPTKLMFTKVEVDQLAPDVGANEYRVELCLFGGRCIPNWGSFTLVK